jgi:ribosomal protein S18 acetylase RimI-like enzyme
MDIRTADRSEETAVLDTLTLAFAADPIVRYWWPKASDYLAWWPRFLLAMGERGFEAGSVNVTEGFEAAAMWLPPGVGPDPAQLAALNMPDAPEGDTTAAELRAEMDRHHPDFPHWYLWAIGVDPARQGRGVGGALMAHMLQRVDAEGMPAYLESSDPKNVPFYERYGFEAVAVIQVRDVPPLTPMIRR